jgi:hypothetical protein
MPISRQVCCGLIGSFAREADRLIAQPLSITLRYLQTLTEIAAEKISTIIFSLPIELLELLKASVRTNADSR